MPAGEHHDCVTGGYIVGAMEVSLLGPVRLSVDGRAILLPAKQRTLVAMLALQPNRTVSTHRLIDGIWGEDATPTAAKTLHTHVFQLRRLLEQSEPSNADGTPILTEGQGYRLRIDPDAVDVHRFERLLILARGSIELDPRQAADQLREALALWQGPPLADVAFEPFAGPEIDRLEELRGSAVEELARARLAVGEHELMIGDLRRAVVETPFREQLWASLMLALVRSGRQAEALLAYREAEAILRRELGVDPGPELQDLAGRIRAGGTRLPFSGGPGETATAVPGRPVVVGARDPRRRQVILIAAIAVLLVGGMTVALAVGQGPPGGSQARTGLLLTEAERELVRRLPTAVRGDCRQASRDEVIERSKVSVTCPLRDVGASRATYAEFETLGAMLAAFTDLKKEAGDPDGSCDTAPSGSHRWGPVGLVGGEVLCYPTGNRSWIVWTYEQGPAQKIMGMAWREDLDWGALYLWWYGSSLEIQ
jgi:DNA-binding SARP family transcriptional activator